ncbi:MAG TPA: ATP-binding protein [Pyrinomonadaceae bacterium]|nr:ATP-binding protein [Pyrinomonadaceae bacterium]
MPLTIERKLPLILFFVVIVLTMLGVAFYQHTGSQQDAFDIEKQTQNTVSKLDEVLRLTLDVDSAVSGFIITGNDSYLAPFESAKPRIIQTVAQLREMMTDSPSELEELAALQGTTDRYLAQAQSKIERRRVEGFDATIASLGDSSERSLTTNIRNSIDRLKTAEQSSLLLREKALDESFFRTIWILILGCVSGVVALGLANIVVSREIGKRRGAEAALINANRDLEDRIGERTRELAQANQSLRLVADEREDILKKEQIARREAEIANRLRDEFMATVSHELKTPLNSILGWARMLKAGDLDDEQITRALSTIIKNSETQNRLIEDLLDVARIISGKLVLEFEQVNATELVQDAIQSVTPIAEARGIRISEVVDDGAAAVTISGDRNRLMQVFSNLLTNAIKFTPENGHVEVALAVRNSRLNVSVTDNGIGIKPEFLPLVFERFRQDSSTPARNGGLGLGLAIVRQLVEMHGGSVSVRSEGLNKGSEFTVELPAQHRADFQLAHQA